IDTGKVYDAKRLRFDHHQLLGKNATGTCATDQVYWHLWNLQIEYLKPLIDLVFCGDTGNPKANPSRELGLHAIFSGWKAWNSERNIPITDYEILYYGFSLLDFLEVRLRKQAEAKAELQEKVVYRSKDNLVWAIKHGSQGSTFAAYEEGARVVLFEGEPIETPGGTTYPIGIMRAGEWQEPHVGNLIEQVADNTRLKETSTELKTWFKHNAGFFAGKGTAKAPVFKPITINIATVAKLVDMAWER
ncbi:MAG: hypothetical protein ACXABY_13395, partial [Candidatus Thorarchaeota archaeon]